MSWGAVAGAAVGVVGSAMSDSGGGGQSQSTSKQPWMPATPWLMENLAQGQRLQTQYQNQPFNAQQQAAYQNQANQGAYMRAAVPSLLRQMQGKQVGFDRSNPNARPTAFNWDGLLSAAGEGQAAQAAQAGQMAQGGQSGGLLDMLSSGSTGAVNSSLTPMAEPPKKEAGTFTQQDMGYTPLQNELLNQGRNPYMMGNGLGPDSFRSAQPTGGYGDFKYGDDPKPGTKAYRDMMEYFMNGGNDPWGKYQLGIKPYAGAMDIYGAGAATDDGGAAAAVGSSANF